MAQVAWLHRGNLLRVDTLPIEWCPWHIRFMCPVCGQIWLERMILSEPAVYSPRPKHCELCPQDLEGAGLPANILNHYETSSGYKPHELLALEFLLESTGYSS
jgi:hypothetical protein